MMAAPGVVSAAVRAGLKCAAEIGKCERGHLLLNSQFHSRVVKCGHRRIQLREQSLLRRQLRAMRIDPAQRTKENLPLQPQRAARLHYLRHLLQLSAESRTRELCLQTRRVF